MTCNCAHCPGSTAPQSNGNNNNNNMKFVKRLSPGPQNRQTAQLSPSRAKKTKAEVCLLWAQALVLCVTVSVCYFNSLKCGLVFDDVTAIRDNRDLRGSTPVWNLFKNDYWGTPMWKEQSHKSYRPLTVLSFRLNYALHGLDPFGYHLVNVILHALVCCLYLRLCRMFLPPLESFVAAELFAVHPIHTEAVTGVVGRAELLSSVFYLTAFFCYVKAAKHKHATDWLWVCLTGVLTTAAMLSKEQGITILGVCIVYDICSSQIVALRRLPRSVLSSNGTGKVGVPPWTRETGRRVVALLLIGFALFTFRVKMMGGHLPSFTRFDNPAAAAPTPTRQLTFNFLFAANTWSLLFPFDLCCDWTMGSIPLIEGLTDMRNVAPFVLYACLTKLVVNGLNTQDQRQGITVLMSVVLCVFPFLPASNLFFYVGFVMAERVLYVPSMGLCILVASGWGYFHQRRKWIGKLSILFLLTMHSCKTIYRNIEWETEMQLFSAGLQVNQRNAKLYNNMGHALEAQHRYHEALAHFQSAIRVQPDDIGAYINVGRVLNVHLHLYKEAEESFMQAKKLLPKPRPGEVYHTKLAPNHLSLFINLANLISRNQSRLEEADALYRQAISMRADYTQAYINRADVLFKMNRTKEAQAVYEKALQYDNNNPDIYYNLGVVYIEQGKALQALAYLNKALEFDPDHEQALMNSAILIQETGDSKLLNVAYERLIKLVDRGGHDTNEKIYFNLAMLAMDGGDSALAEKWFRKAVEVKADFRSALFNLALLLSSEQRQLEAASFLAQLLQFHTDHIKGLILLGDIYVNTMRDLDAAEQCYLRILQLDPDNVQGLHNLCVVYVERGSLTLAEQCFVKALRLSPHEEYIQRHLSTVRTVLQQTGNRSADNIGPMHLNTNRQYSRPESRVAMDQARTQSQHPYL